MDDVVPGNQVVHRRRAAAVLDGGDDEGVPLPVVDRVVLEQDAVELIPGRQRRVEYAQDLAGVVDAPHHARRRAHEMVVAERPSTPLEVHEAARHVRPEEEAHFDPAILPFQVAPLCP